MTQQERKKNGEAEDYKGLVYSLKLEKIRIWREEEGSLELLKKDKAENKEKKLENKDEDDDDSFQKTFEQESDRGRALWAVSLLGSFICYSWKWKKHFPHILRVWPFDLANNRGRKKRRAKGQKCGFVYLLLGFNSVITFIEVFYMSAQFYLNF